MKVVESLWWRRSAAHSPRGPSAASTSSRPGRPAPNRACSVLLGRPVSGVGRALGDLPRRSSPGPGPGPSRARPPLPTDAATAAPGVTAPPAVRSVRLRLARVRASPHGGEGSECVGRQRPSCVHAAPAPGYRRIRRGPGFGSVDGRRTVTVRAAPPSRAARCGHRHRGRVRTRSPQGPRPRPGTVTGRPTARGGDAAGPPAVRRSARAPVPHDSRLEPKEGA